MKMLLFSFLFSAFLLNDKTGLTLEKDRILLAIDKNTTQAQLSGYQKELSKKNISLQIEKVLYDDGQKIKYIKINVDCNDGFKGSAGETFTNKPATIGFYRVYNTKGSPFGMSPAAPAN